VDRRPNIWWCAQPLVPHIQPQSPQPRAMKMPSWLKKTKNDAEESSSSRRHCSQSSPPSTALLDGLPPVPRPEVYVMRPPCVVATVRPRHNRCYVPLDKCEKRWRDGEGIDQNDVSLSAGWYLNRARVSVLSVPQPGAKLMAEVDRRIRNFPRRYAACASTRTSSFGMTSSARSILPADTRPS
jgi:hypothetical protein